MDLWAKLFKCVWKKCGPRMTPDFGAASFERTALSFSEEGEEAWHTRFFYCRLVIPDGDNGFESSYHAPVRGDSHYMLDPFWSVIPSTDELISRIQWLVTHGLMAVLLVDFWVYRRVQPLCARTCLLCDLDDREGHLNPASWESWDLVDFKERMGKLILDPVEDFTNDGFQPFTSSRAPSSVRYWFY